MARTRLEGLTAPPDRRADARTIIAHHMARIIRANATEQSQSIERYVADAIRRSRVDDADAVVMFVQAVAIIAIEDFVEGGGPKYALGGTVQR